MASLNITSLLKHLDELNILQNDNPIDVLAINETRLDSSITDCKEFIPGYEICVSHISSGVTRALIGGGGGVYSYIRVLPDGFLLK